MTDRPIIFSAPMVKALLDGRKTQTRRVLKPQPPAQPEPNCHPSHKPRHEAPYLDAYCGEPRTPQNPRGMSRDWHWWQVDDRPGPVACHVPYAPGDRLWVREVCATWGGNTKDAAYRATMGDDNWSDLLHDVRRGAPWQLRSPIHMPRWASRITLTVTEVRVQRLQQISAEDVAAEGACELAFLPPTDEDTREARDVFRTLWHSLHGPEAWAANPWVCAITFTVRQGNIDHA